MTKHHPSKLDALLSELAGFADEERFYTLYINQADPHRIVRSVLPHALEWLIPRYPEQSSRLLRQACEVYFNQTTLKEALALIRIAWREHPITLRMQRPPAGTFNRAALRCISDGRPAGDGSGSASASGCRVVTERAGSGIRAGSYPGSCGCWMGPIRKGV